MANANRAERKERAKTFRNAVSIMMSRRVYELRTKKESPVFIACNIERLSELRAKSDPEHAHMYRTVSKKVVATIIQ